MSELAAFAELLRSKTPVTFQHGFGFGKPRCDPDGWCGVGVTDAAGHTRVVGMNLPEHILGPLAARRERRPLKRLGLAAVRGVLQRTAGTPTEDRYEGDLVATRRSPDAPWNDVTLPDADGGRKLSNDPTWIVRLLDAEPGALGSRAETSQGSERSIDVTLDPAAVEALLPADEARRATEPGHREPLATLALQITVAGNEPLRIATSTGVSNDTGEPLWRVLELTAFGVDPDAVDLWDAWARLSSQE